jgi:hypothetical protein
MVAYDKKEGAEEHTLRLRHCGNSGALEDLEGAEFMHLHAGV